MDPATVRKWVLLQVAGESGQVAGEVGGADDPFRAAVAGR